MNGMSHRIKKLFFSQFSFFLIFWRDEDVLVESNEESVIINATPYVCSSAYQHKKSLMDKHVAYVVSH